MADSQNVPSDKPTDAEIVEAVRRWGWFIDATKDYKRLGPEEQELYDLAKRRFT